MPKTDIKRFRTIGHKLNPIVTIADKGLTETVLKELMRALSDHELIKITVRIPNREDKKAVIDTVCNKVKAELIQSIGHTALLYKANKNPNPRLSNILRNL